MKHPFLLTIFATCALSMHAGDMSNSIEYGQLYIVGDATSTSWDLGAAVEMPRISDGVFEWTGRLVGGKEFKFMNTREAWHKHIVSVKSGTVAAIGQTYPLNFYADWSLDGSLDLKFKVAETGNYTVTVDLTSMRMKVTDQVRTATRPERFYLVGSSTDNKVIEIPDVHGVEYKAPVALRPGYVYLIDTPEITDRTQYFVPRFPETDITYGQDCDVFLYPADSNAKGWSVSIPDEYMIYIDSSRLTFKCKRFAQYKNLYLVGGCCELDWNYWDESNNRFFPDVENPDVMVWEGELRIGWNKKTDATGKTVYPEEPDKFKILTAQDWFRDTYHPYQVDAPAVGSTEARISGGEDLKWTIAKDGIYRLELNTKTEILKVTCLGESETHENAAHDIATVSQIDSSEVDAQPCYYNLQGIRIDQPQSGIYIVTDGKKSAKYVKR